MPHKGDKRKRVKATKANEVDMDDDDKMRSRSRNVERNPTVRITIEGDVSEMTIARMGSLLAREDDTPPIVVCQNPPTAPPSQPLPSQPVPWTSYPSRLREDLKTLKDLATTVTELLNKLVSLIKGLTIAE